VGTDPGGLNRIEAWKQEEFSEEENRRLESPVKFAKSRGSSDQGGVTRELTLSAGVENQSPSDFGVSAFGVGEVRVLHLVKSRVAIPELTGAVDHQRDTWHQIPEIGTSEFGVFNSKGNLHRGFAIREIPK
jgi:hypothetical protein